MRWDHEADVVIAGYGIAGAAAAVEAAGAGADVLVLERSGSWGGAAAMAGGFIYLETPQRWDDAALDALGLAAHRHLKAGAVHAHLLRPCA